jgi:hypothetical protein
MLSPATEFQLEKINLSEVTKQGFLLNVANRSLSHQERFEHTKLRPTNTIYCQNNDNIKDSSPSSVEVWNVNIRPHPLYAFMA